MGRIVLCLFLAMALAGCASTLKLSQDAHFVQKVVEAPGLTKAQIIERSKVWSARSFRQSMARWYEENDRRSVLQYENVKEGMMIASGAIPYPHEPLTSESYKTGWEVRFTLEVDANDGSAMITFSRLMMFVPSIFCGYYSQSTSSYETQLYAEEFTRVKPAFIDLADKLGEFLRLPEDKWRWFPAPALQKD
ncbi:MAG TPA: DUF4468 domain-containing protein [Geobacteraceae bacterium]|nr:DUF4468 domain-containing protein [Geobacteraceae bacterium]